MGRPPPPLLLLLLPQMHCWHRLLPLMWRRQRQLHPRLPRRLPLRGVPAAPAPTVPAASCPPPPPELPPLQAASGPVKHPQQAAPEPPCRQAGVDMQYIVSVPVLQCTVLSCRAPGQEGIAVHHAGSADTAAGQQSRASWSTTHPPTQSIAVRSGTARLACTAHTSRRSRRSTCTFSPDHLLT